MSMVNTFSNFLFRDQQLLLLQLPLKAFGLELLKNLLKTEVMCLYVLKLEAH